jgi:hypothetical protein
MRFAFTLLMIVTLIIGMIGFGIQHEKVHQIIYEEYGIKSKVNYLDGWGMSTTTIGNYSKCGDACETSHNINETVGYHLMPFFLVFGIGLLIIIAQLEFLIEQKEEKDGERIE